MLSLIGSLQPDPFDSRHSLTATEALATHPVFRKMEAVQEADDIEEVEGTIGMMPDPTTEAEDEIREDWTQDQGILTQREKEDSLPPAPVSGKEDAKVEKAKKRKRKNKDLENEPTAEVIAEGAAPADGEGEAKPPKKKKKKKSESAKEGGDVEMKDVADGEHGEDETKEKKKKKKKKREIVSEL